VNARSRTLNPAAMSTERLAREADAIRVLLNRFGLPASMRRPLAVALDKLEAEMLRRSGWENGPLPDIDYPR